MIFAAGFGTRMKDLTRNRPKPLIKVAGRALIDHALDLTKPFPDLRRVVNLHYLSELLRAHLASTDVLFSEETPAILDTGGGLRQALPLLQSNPVFTTNTDAVWRGPNPFQLLANAWRPKVMDALLLCVPLQNAVGHKGDGDFTIAPDGRLQRGPGLVYSGVQIIRTDGLQDIPDPAFSLNLLWNRIAADGRLYGLPYDGKWCDVGHPEGITLAEDMLHV
ncbi:nucleotidyltransferase family protein [Primorskyibacter marinus]|uniref:nucleotidyltransferase family protein n=1 Tax=Primorskyibacter marinus TaxID=1977320 RepID=UPI000E3075A7|nr:nucleotidyltransferase family protein [Primorskyibacter marinus]